MPGQQFGHRPVSGKGHGKRTNKIAGDEISVFPEARYRQNNRRVAPATLCPDCFLPVSRLRSLFIYPDNRPKMIGSNSSSAFCRRPSQTTGSGKYTPPSKSEDTYACSNVGVKKGFMQATFHQGCASGMAQKYRDHNFATCF